MGREDLWISEDNSAASPQSGSISTISLHISFLMIVCSN